MADYGVMALAALADVFPALRRRPAPGPRPPLGPYVPADEPAHSDACYCAVQPVWALPCGNCRCEGYVQGGAS